MGWLRNFTYGLVASSAFLVGDALGLEKKIDGPEVEVDQKTQVIARGSTGFEKTRGFGKKRKERKERVEPIYFGNYMTVFGESLNEQADREKDLSRHLKVSLIHANRMIDDENPFEWSYFRPYSSFVDAEDTEVMKDYVAGLLGEAGEEMADKVEWIDNMENFFKGLFNFRLSIKGKDANGRKASPSLDEERRVEDRDMEESSSLEFVEPFFGRNYRFDAKLGYEFPGLNVEDCLKGVKGSLNLRDFQLYGHKFHSAELEVKADQEVKFEMTKLICDENFVRLKIKSKDFRERPNKYSLSFNFEVSDKSNIRVTTEYNSGSDTYQGKLLWVGEF